MEQLAAKQAKKKTGTGNGSGLKRRRKSVDEGEDRRPGSTGTSTGEGHAQVDSGDLRTRGPIDNDLENGPGRTIVNGEPEFAPQQQQSLPPSVSTRNDFMGLAHIQTHTHTPPLHATPSSSIKQNDLLRYMFASGPVLDLRYGYTDTASIRQCDSGESDLWEEMGGEVWTEAPSSAHLSLDQETIAE